MLKVLHIAETIKGGVGTIINSLIKINGVESIVIAPNDQGQIINGRTFGYERRGRTICSFIRLANTAISIIKVEKPDVVHLHSTFAGVIIRFLFAIKLLKKKDLKVIYTPHAFSFLREGAFLHKKAYALIERVLYRYTDKIICTSNYELNEALKYGLNKSKMEVIYNGIDIISRAQNTNLVVEGENKKECPGDKIRIVFLGRFDYQKGYDRLLYIINNLDSSLYSFDIIGDGVNDGVEKIQRDNVTYHGWIEFNKLEDYFKNVNFMIMPSRWESFGLVAVESQSFGVPVLAANCSSLPEVIIDGVTGVLDFSNLEEVVKFINNQDASFWTSKSESCIKFSHSNFSQQKMNYNYLVLYTSILGKYNG